LPLFQFKAVCGIFSRHHLKMIRLSLTSQMQQFL
jgi:hypothetical protein